MKRDLCIKIVGLVGAVAAMAFGLVGCQPSTKPKSASGKLKVVATTMMVGDLVQNVGGDAVEVQVLMGPGVDPHLYKASPGDVQKLEEADLVVFSGLHLEGKMADILEKVAESKGGGMVTSGVPSEFLLTDPQSPTYPDPHVWFDVKTWAECVGPVSQMLAKKDPSRRQDFIDRAQAYRKKLLELDTWAREQIATIPKDRRVLVTAHDAFRYFGRAYDIEVMGIQGISTESEAGLAEVNRLVDVIVKRKIPAIFVETSVSQKNVRAILEGAQSRGSTIRIGGTLYSDSMGTFGTPDSTYEGMVRHNVKQIVEALK